jgi:hypothetical protein
MLYYPFTAAPDSIVDQAVLYWDDLATVVGPDWRTDISPRMLELHDAGLYRPIHPYAAYGPEVLEWVRGELYEVLRAVPYDRLRPPIRGSAQPSQTLNVGKVGRAVVNLLIEQGHLLRFRARYDDERRRMMLAIDELLHQLRHLGRHPLDAGRLVERELTEAVADLQSAARGTRIVWVTRTVAVPVAVAAGTLAAGLPSYAVPLAVLGGLAVNIATVQSRAPAGTKPYRYLHRTIHELRNVRPGGPA